MTNANVILPDKKAGILAALQNEILRLQGFKTNGNDKVDVGLGPINDAFPNSSFPLNAVHEFLSAKVEDSAATSGFVAGLLSALMRENGVALWISESRTLFPPAL